MIELNAHQKSNQIDIWTCFTENAQKLQQTPQSDESGGENQATTMTHKRLDGVPRGLRIDQIEVFVEVRSCRCVPLVVYKVQHKVDVLENAQRIVQAPSDNQHIRSPITVEDVLPGDKKELSSPNESPA